MADVDAARRELEAALGPDAVLHRPARAASVRPRRSMVEGACALVALPTTTEQIQACVRTAVAHDLPIVPGAAARGSRERRRRSGTRSSSRRRAWTVSSRSGPRTGSRRWNWPAEPRPREPPASDGLDLRPRPIEPADVVDRRERQHERRRPALPRVRGDERARARGRRRDVRRLLERFGAEGSSRPDTTFGEWWWAARARWDGSRGVVCESCHFRRRYARAVRLRHRRGLAPPCRRSSLAASCRRRSR